MKSESEILSEFSKTDNYLENLKSGLTALFPSSIITDILLKYNTEIESVYEISVDNKLSIRYIVRMINGIKSHILSVRFSDGNFWIISQSDSTDKFEFPRENIQWFLDYYNNSNSIIPSNQFICYSDNTDAIYKVDVAKDKETCTCKGFTFNGIHHSLGDNKRCCKHLNKVLSCYPEYIIENEPESTNIVDSDGKKRYPRSIFDIYVKQINSVINQFGIITRSNICGSYRRLKPMVSDLDILVQLKNNCDWTPFLDYCENIMGWKLIKEIGKGSAKAAYMIDGYIHVDFMKISEEQWPFALLHFTGSKLTNIAMRRKANQLGYTLNQYGLIDSNGNYVKDLKSEEDIFKFLQIPFKQPWDR